jgi:hypothetical protein
MADTDDDYVQIHIPDHVKNADPQQIVRAFRLIEYCGPAEWVIDELTRSINGRKSIMPNKWIEGKTIIAPEYTTELDVAVDQIVTALRRPEVVPDQEIMAGYMTPAMQRMYEEVQENEGPLNV